MDTIKINKPRQCDLSISDHCTLRCKMCKLWVHDLSFRDSNWMQLQDYKKLFHELRDFVEDPFYVSFGGGEPLLNPIFFDILKICKEVGFRTYFPTNAYLLNEENAKKINEAGVFLIGLSLESLDRETHDFLRGKEGCWERVMKAIGYLEKDCPDVLINILTIIMGTNLEEIVELTKWVHKHPRLSGIIFQAIQKPFIVPCQENWYELEEYSFLWPKDIARANSVIEELITLKQFSEQGCKICNPVSQLKLFKLYFDNPRGFIKPARCHMADTVIRGDLYGNIKFCEEMESIGNVKESNISDIWYSQKADEIRERIYNCNKNCHLLVNCFYDGKPS